MRIPRIHAASLALAGALAVAGAAAANAQVIYQTPGYYYGPGVAYSPGYTVSPGYGSYAYAPTGGMAYATSPLPSTTLCPPMRHLWEERACVLL